MSRRLLRVQALTMALLGSAHGHTVAADAADCPPAATPLTAEAIAAGVRTARDHGFLWRVSKDGRTSYLYGTIHAGRQAWLFPGPTIVEALRNSDTVALELDVLDPDIQHRLQASVGSSRSEALPAALAERLERRKAAECVDAGSWLGHSPELQVASLTLLAARREGLEPSYAIEIVLAGMARRLDKPVASLETPEAQMQALKSASRSEALAFVRDGLDELESGRARPLIARFVRMWADGDHAELASYGQWCNCLRTPAERAAMKRLLDDRNPALAEGIDRLHGSGRRVFAAVGSLHMIGPNGLPSLMQQRGYTVERSEIAR